MRSAYFLFTKVDLFLYSVLKPLKIYSLKFFDSSFETILLEKHVHLILFEDGIPIPIESSQIECIGRIK